MNTADQALAAAVLDATNAKAAAEVQYDTAETEAEFKAAFQAMDAADRRLASLRKIKVSR